MLRSQVQILLWILNLEMCQSGLLYFPAKEVVAAKGPVGSNPAISAKYRDLVEKGSLS